MSEMKSFTWLVHRSLTCYFLVGCLFIPTNVNKLKKRTLAIESAIKVSNSLSLPNKTRFGVCACESGNFDIDTKDRFAIVLISKLLVKMPVERRVQLVGRSAATIHAVLEEVTKNYYFQHPSSSVYMVLTNVLSPSINTMTYGAAV